MARYAMNLTLALSNPVEILGLPKIPIPLDTFNACLMVPHYRFKLVPNTIATAFGE